MPDSIYAHSRMPSPLRSLKQLLSLFRYWQRNPLARCDLSATVARFLR